MSRARASREDAVDAFVSAARGYCSLIEHPRPADRLGFLERLAPVLAELIRAALELPEVRTRSQPILPFTAKATDGQPLVSSLRRRLGDADPFWIVFDPRREEAPVCGSLADGLADIYQDLKRGLIAWEQWGEGGRHEAVWKWRFDFREHWGYHALEALRAIYWRALRT